MSDTVPLKREISAERQAENAVSAQRQQDELAAAGYKDAEVLYMEVKGLTLSFLKEITLSSGVHSFNFNIESRQDFRDRRDAAKTSNSNRTFKTFSNDLVEFTPADYDDIFLALESKGNDVFAAWQTDKVGFPQSDYSMTHLKALKAELTTQLNTLIEENA